MRIALLLAAPPEGGAAHETPFGRSALIREEGGLLLTAAGWADPRATVTALHSLGATHLWLCESVGALSPLLDVGDWLIPDDFIDGTRGQHYTFYDQKAGGYVQQVPPFDPASRAALLAVARGAAPRPFQRGVAAVVAASRLETPAEAAFWARAGAQVVSRWLSPCLPLAREREMAVAALLRIDRLGGAPAESPGDGDAFIQIARRAAGILAANL